MPRESTKQDRAHRVPLAAMAIENIGSLPGYKDAGESAFLFTTTFGKRPVSGFSKVKARLDKLIADAAEKGEGPLVVPRTLHDLRRTAASGMARLARTAATGIIVSLLLAANARQATINVSGIKPNSPLRRAMSMVARMAMATARLSGRSIQLAVM